MQFVWIVLAVIVGIFAYNIGMERYEEYRHDRAVQECKAETQAPKWADGISDWACERLVD